MTSVTSGTARLASTFFQTLTSGECTVAALTVNPALELPAGHILSVGTDEQVGNI